MGGKGGGKRQRARDRDDGGEDSADKKQVFVTGIGGLAEDDIRGFFDSVGDVERLKILQGDGDSKGSCFVTFATEEQAQVAVDLNDSEFSGRTIYVRYARPGRQKGAGKSSRHKQASRDRSEPPSDDEGPWRNDDAEAPPSGTSGGKRPRPAMPEPSRKTARTADSDAERPATPELIAEVKRLQKEYGFFVTEAWYRYVDDNGGGDRDPNRHPAQFLEDFVAEAESAVSRNIPLVKHVKDVQRSSQEAHEKWANWCETEGNNVLDPKKHEAWFLERYLEMMGVGPKGKGKGKSAPPVERRERPHDKKVMPRSLELFLAQVPARAEDRDIANHFARYGEVVHVRSVASKNDTKIGWVTLNNVKEDPLVNVKDSHWMFGASFMVKLNDKERGGPPGADAGRDNRPGRLPPPQALVERVQQLQQEYGFLVVEAWHRYTEQSGRGDTDPNNHSGEFLQEFIEEAEKAIAKNASLVTQVKSLQSSSERIRAEWDRFCTDGGNNVKDPKKHEAWFLEEFIAKCITLRQDSRPELGPPKGEVKGKGKDKGKGKGKDKDKGKRQNAESDADSWRGDRQRHDRSDEHQAASQDWKQEVSRPRPKEPPTPPPAQARPSQPSRPPPSSAAPKATPLKAKAAPANAPPIAKEPEKPERKHAHRGGKKHQHNRNAPKEEPNGEGESLPAGAVRLVVRKLTKDTEDDDLDGHFCQYGEVISSKVQIDKKGNSRCFAFVTIAGLSDEEKQGMLKDTHDILGQEVEVKEAPWKAPA